MPEIVKVAAEGTDRFSQQDETLAERSTLEAPVCPLRMNIFTE
jgi:hypothetical protein